MKKNPKLIYVYDALCSWCYAFHKQLVIILQDNPMCELQVVSGGMFIGDNRRHVLDMVSPAQIPAMYQPLKDYGQADISDKYINDLIIEQNPYIDSERPARGLAVFRNYRPLGLEQLEFVNDLQTQMYVDGVNPNSDEYFTNVLPKWGIPEDDFMSQLNGEKAQEGAEADFKLARELGVTAFPQLIYRTPEDKYYLVAKGFSMAGDVDSRIDAINQEV